MQHLRRFGTIPLTWEDLGFDSRAGRKAFKDSCPLVEQSNLREINPSPSRKLPRRSALPLRCRTHGGHASKRSDYHDHVAQFHSLSPIGYRDSKMRHYTHDQGARTANGARSALSTRSFKIITGNCQEAPADSPPRTSGRQTNAPTDRRLVDKPTDCAARSRQPVRGALQIRSVAIRTTWVHRMASGRPR